MTEIKLPSNKKFGLFFTFIFLILGTYFFYYSNYTIGLASIILAFLILLILLINERLLLPFNRAWMKLGYLIGLIISPIILSLIFFVIFTPVSIVLKIFNRDELKLKMNKSFSHWTERKIKSFDSESFKNQF